MEMYGAIPHVGDPYATFGQSWEPSNLYILMFDPMEATSACLTIIIYGLAVWSLRGQTSFKLSWFGNEWLFISVTV